MKAVDDGFKRDIFKIANDGLLRIGLLNARKKDEAKTGKWI